MAATTGIDLGPDSCVLVGARPAGSVLDVSAVHVIEAAAWPSHDVALVETLKAARRRKHFPRSARVIAWGLSEPLSPDDPVVAAALRPISAAGFRIGAVLSPVQALARLAAQRPRTAAGTTLAWLAINTHGAAIAVVRDGRVLFSRTFDWTYRKAELGSRAELLQRYSLVAQLAPEVRQAISTVRSEHGAIVEAAVTCGDLPDLRSLTMPLIEELDIEVETMDSPAGLRPRGRAKDSRFAELAPSIRLACAAATAPAQRRRQFVPLLRAAAIVVGGVGLGLAGYAYWAGALGGSSANTVSTASKVSDRPAVARPPLTSTPPAQPHLPAAKQESVPPPSVPVTQSPSAPAPAANAPKQAPPSPTSSIAAATKQVPPIARVEPPPARPAAPIVATKQEQPAPAKPNLQAAAQHRPAVVEARQKPPVATPAAKPAATAMKAEQPLVPKPGATTATGAVPSPPASKPVATTAKTAPPPPVSTIAKAAPVPPATKPSATIAKAAAPSPPAPKPGATTAKAAASPPPESKPVAQSSKAAVNPPAPATAKVEVPPAPTSAPAIAKAEPPPARPAVPIPASTPAPSAAAETKPQLGPVRPAPAPDRTEPAVASPARPRPQVPLKDPLPRVDSILIDQERRLAIIDGEILSVGDVVGQRVVARIEPRFVIFREPSGLAVRVSLRSGAVGHLL